MGPLKILTLKLLYTVKKQQLELDAEQIRKGVHQGCILLPCLFNLYTEYIMRNTGLDEAQAGTKIARRNINNLRYAHDHPYGRKQRRTKQHLESKREE